MTKSPQFRELQIIWYDKLKKSGFEDIENTSHRDKPLKKWHSFKTKIIQNRKERQVQEYQALVDGYNHHPEFIEVCDFLSKHGNSKFNSLDVSLVWKLHSDGLTVRKISEITSRSKSRVHDVIRKLREWMALC